MKFRYNLWRKRHFEEASEIIPRLKEVGVDSIIFVTALSTGGFKSLHPVGPFKGFLDITTREDSRLLIEAVKIARDQGLSVWAKPHWHPRRTNKAVSTRGNDLSWWPGLIVVDDDMWNRVHYMYCERIVQEINPDVLVVGTELASMSTSPVFVNTINKLRDLYPDLTMGYGANVWQPLTLHWAFSFAKAFMGNEKLIREAARLLNVKIPPDLVRDVSSRIFRNNGIGNAERFPNLDFFGLSAYYYPTFDTRKTDAAVYNAYLHYPVSFKVRLFGFLPYTIRTVINYGDLVRQWASGKGLPGRKRYPYLSRLEVTETDVPYFSVMRNNFEDYSAWWYGTIKFWEDFGLEHLGVWEDGEFGWWIKAIEGYSHSPGL